jgi:choline dehydrogenase-like flavoprotein
MSAAQLRDLNAVPSAHHTERTRVCVIGAGAAGIYVALRLAEQGVDVVVVEAGNFVAAGGSTLLGADIQFAADQYRGATAGRFYAIGGTTTQWGGFLIPHGAFDLRHSGGAASDAWAGIVRTVNDNRVTVLKTLGWTGLDGFSEQALEPIRPAVDILQSTRLNVRSGLMLPHGRKNFVTLLRNGSSSLSGVTLFYNAVVTELFTHQDRGGRVEGLRAVSTGGKTLDVMADEFVVAAGAIESARILLEADRMARRPIIRRTSATGCFLSDHLSVSIATVGPETRADAIRLFAPRFEQGWMRTFRILDGHPAPDDPRAFAHFTFDTDSPGFAATKEVLRAYQSRRRPRVDANDVMAGFADVAKLGFHRYARRRLYVRPDKDVHLQLDVEQKPHRENRVALSERRDRFGRPAAEIHWRISDGDVANVRRVAQRFLAKWPGQAPSFPQLKEMEHLHDSIKPYDAYHPVGTCRLGSDEEAVVDENLKVWGSDNLWVVSTGVLPSAGTANPTFTMLCLGEQLATRLASSQVGPVAMAEGIVHA